MQYQNTHPPDNRYWHLPKLLLTLDDHPGYQAFSKEKMNDVVKIDASLAAMQFMLVARAHGYDTNAIGGFVEDQLAETFGLAKERYVPVMILSVGKAKEAGYESVRLAAEKITEFK